MKVYILWGISYREFDEPRHSVVGVYLDKEKAISDGPQDDAKRCKLLARHHNCPPGLVHYEVGDAHEVIE